jgi:exodeoxyribonuclease V alpha subunit
MDALVCEVVSWRDEPRESSGWHIINVRALDDAQHTVTGCNLPRPGSRCEFEGEWQHTKWGEQFHVRSIRATKPPLSAAGVQRWLEDRCEGIGRVKAAAILAHYNNDASALWASLARGHEELARAPGISPELAEHVHEAFEADGAAREHYATLRGWRLTQHQINRIIKHWPVAEACRRLYEDPYLLAEHVSGFGFKRADEIANTVGVPKHSRMRLRAGILHSMSEAAQQGHVFGDVHMFAHLSRTFLDVPMEETRAVLEELLNAKRLMTPDGARIYLPVFERAERETAAATAALMQIDAGPTVGQFTAAAEAAALEIGRELHPKQLAAIELVANMARPLGFITGGPGTGKTTILEYAVKALEAQNVGVVLAAPTGKAAKRMTEATERDAMTLHRLLEFRPEYVVDCETCQRSSGAFKRVAIDRFAVIVDEASMVDLQLWTELMRAVERGGNRAVVRFVGDADQLPPVGPGQPFQDHLKALADTSAVVRLESVFRQGEGSWVAQSAPMVLAGKMPDLKQRPDFRFLEVVRADHVPAAIEALLEGQHDTPEWSGSTLAPDYVPVKRAPTGVAAPVLVPQHKGLAGVAVINRLLAEFYNPHAAARSEEDLIRIGLEDGTDLRVGARVMATKNDYQRGVRNGDTGVIEHMEMHRDKRGEPRPEVLVRLDPDETTSRAILEAQRAGLPLPATPLVRYKFAEAREQLVLSYAMTIHKSQGSQYPWVVVVCHSTHTRMLTRRLIYTALTRASEGVVIVGNREGLERAVHNAQEIPRNTYLAQRLRAGYPAGS